MRILNLLIFFIAIPAFGMSWLFIGSKFDLKAISDLYYDPTVNASFNSGSAANTDPVNLWVDQSHNHNDAVSGSAPGTPTYQTNIFPNGTPGVLFSAASSQSLRMTNTVTGLAAWSVVAVILPVSWPANVILFGGPVPSGHFNQVRLLRWDGSGSIFTSEDNTVDPVNVFFSVTTAPSTGAGHVIIVTSGTDPSTATYYIDGVAQTTTGAAGTTWDQGYNTLGGGFGNFRFADFYCGDFVVIHHSISSSEVTKAYNFEKTKYGL